LKEKLFQLLPITSMSSNL